MQNVAKYPALMSIMVLLSVGVMRGRDDLVAPILLKPRLKVTNYEDEQAAAVAAHPWRVFDGKAADALPRWGKNMTVFYAESHLMRADLDDVLAVYESDADRRASAMGMAEYLMGFAQLTQKHQVPFMGEGVLRGRHIEGPLVVASEVRARVVHGRGNLVADLFGGDTDAAVAALDLLDAENRSLDATQGVVVTTSC